MIWVFYIAIILCVTGVVIYGSRKKGEPIVVSYDAPKKIDRNDFGFLEQDIVVIAFTSNNCDSCLDMWSKVAVLESSNVGIFNCEFQDEKSKELHKKYNIDAVPTIIICDINGVTQKAFLGQVSATDLWAGVAQVRGDEVPTC